MRLLDQLVTEREEISATMEGVVTRAADDHRDISEPEDANLRGLKTRADELDARIGELRNIQVANLEAAKLRAEVQATDDSEHRSAAGIANVSVPLPGTRRFQSVRTSPASSGRKRSRTARLWKYR